MGHDGLEFGAVRIPKVAQLSPPAMENVPESKYLPV